VGFNSLELIPEKLRERSLYIKLAEMLDYVIDKSEEELKDVKYKYHGPEFVRTRVIDEVIIESGYGYIKNVIDTLTNVEYDIMHSILNLVHFLKSHRDGLELVLKILGFEFNITEWWESIDQKSRATHEGVTYEAVDVGGIGDSIVLDFDGIKTIAQIVDDWNTANPYLRVVHDAGDDSLVSSIASVRLSGGNEAELQTFDMEINMNESLVPNPIETLTKLQIFIKHYIFPRLDALDLQYEASFETNIIAAGFTDYSFSGGIAVGTL